VDETKARLAPASRTLYCLLSHDAGPPRNAAARRRYNEAQKEPPHMAAKFIQVAVGATPGEDAGDVIDSVYALDASGGVWFYNAEDMRWEGLSPERYEGAKPGADEDDGES
jgi:hypothetical protein